MLYDAIWGDLHKHYITCTKNPIKPDVCFPTLWLSTTYIFQTTSTYPMGLVGVFWRTGKSRGLRMDMLLSSEIYD
ncbi:unnamed protein product [Penicillium camemberti]|uniref:Str. FM013 n=1 Tax=Penicillium camemberti (strain FM 013) TaxID=1429867 RepID=A0A0G4PTB3_PENC3|nr:unnamed protein product [Penicillium camemberti]